MRSSPLPFLSLSPLLSPSHSQILPSASSPHLWPLVLRCAALRCPPSLLSYSILPYPLLRYPLLRYPLLRYPLLRYPLLRYPPLLLSSPLDVTSRPTASHFFEISIEPPHPSNPTPPFPPNHHYLPPSSKPYYLPTTSNLTTPYWTHDHTHDHPILPADHPYLLKQIYTVREPQG